MEQSCRHSETSTCVKKTLPDIAIDPHNISTTLENTEEKPEACCTRCSENPNCVAYTIYFDTTSKWFTCTLKSVSFPREQKNSTLTYCYASGIVNQVPTEEPGDPKWILIMVAALVVVCIIVFAIGCGIWYMKRLNNKLDNLSSLDRSATEVPKFENCGTGSEVGKTDDFFEPTTTGDTVQGVQVPP